MSKAEDPCWTIFLSDSPIPVEVSLDHATHEALSERDHGAWSGLLAVIQHQLDVEDP